MISANYEAKRKKHRARDNEETVEKHSGQIFCEMLGQVCQKEFWGNDRSKYQEVHCLHVFHPINRLRLLLSMPHTIFSTSTMPSFRMHTFLRLPYMAPTSETIPRNVSHCIGLENITCDQEYIALISSRTILNFYGILPAENLMLDISLITMKIPCINMYFPLFFFLFA